MSQFTQGAKKRFSWRKEPVEAQTLNRAMSFQPPPRGWVLETVSAYNLKWYLLHKWLVETFKDEGGKFEERQNMDNDDFLFYAPRRLREDELLHIDKLRETNKHDKKRQEDRESHSPDP